MMAENNLGKEALNSLTNENNPMFRKVGADLTLLYEEHKDYLETFTVLSFESDNDLLQVNNGYVVIDAVSVGNTTGNTTTLLKDLEELGLQQGSMYGSVVSGVLPIEAIDEMASLESLNFARPAYRPITNIGLTTSQADVAINAETARTEFGVDGSGVTVGALSDSYDVLGGASDDVASGDLPGIGNPFGNTATVNVLLDDLFPFNIDEGRGMLQLIHDVAPGAELAFHTAFLGQASFANGIVDLANVAGADVIVDDVIYLAEPMFQDGIIAQAVDTVVADGVSYFSSAGNNGRQSYESNFRLGLDDTANTGYRFHDFDPSDGVDIFQKFTLDDGDIILLSFQWDEPFASVGGVGSSNDLNIFVYDTDDLSGNVLASAVDFNVGGDPVEILFFQNTTGATADFHLAIGKFEPVGGPDPTLIKYVEFGQADNIEYATNSSTIYGHANAAGAEAVGAAFYQQTPAFGTDPAVLESFSSAGTTPILFDTAGNRLATPEIRPKPEIVAPDGTNTTFFPPFPGQDVEGDGFPNFFGTSAAAPHAAAVAALMLEAVPGTTPEVIYDILERTALDMDDPFTPGFDEGFDNGTGFGLIQADLAIEELLDANGSISGIKWNDLNGNGVRESDEPGLENWTIYLDQNQNGKLDTGETFTRTDAEGNYSFTDLKPDTYTVAEVVLPGWKQTFPGGSGTYTIELDPGEIVNSIDFGNQRVSPAIGDPILGTPEDDQLTIFESPVIVLAGAGNDLVDTSATSGGNRLYGGEGDDELFASTNDRLFGEAGFDILDASVGQGNNRLYGGDNGDILVAGTNDLLFGQEGNDILFAGNGDNLLTGGDDADQFWIAAAAFPSTANTITDFELDVDVLVIGGLGVTFEDIAIAQNEHDVLISTLGQDLAVLKGVQGSALDSDNFVFL
ncbi:MAG: S8 family serine peptidase [Moorea sp. SIO2I5]|nr:S8 family serine peptidase [Moorena sp. SIO2I5]